MNNQQMKMTNGLGKVLMLSVIVICSLIYSYLPTSNSGFIGVATLALYLVFHVFDRTLPPGGPPNAAP